MVCRHGPTHFGAESRMMGPMTLFALSVIGLALVAVGLRFPVFPVMLAIPATFLVLRVGGGGNADNLSIADVILVVATVAALPLMRWSGARQLKQLFALVLIYQASTLYSVFDHPNRYDIGEWFHQPLLVAGSALVGYVIVDRGHAKQALSLFLSIAAALSIWVVAEFPAHGLHSGVSLPGGLQKNFLGDLFVAAVLIAQFKPDWSGLKGRWVQWAKYICVLGVVASGSRQAMVTLVVVVGVVYLRQRGTDRRSKILVAALIPVGIVAYLTIAGQLSSTQINSLSIRSVSFSQSLALWHQYPLFGVGERFWYTGLYGPVTQPPNAEISMLATGGIVGLLGFLVLILGSLRILWRLPAAAGTLAFAVLLARVIGGQFDIFWVSASGSLPWMIAGMGLAAASGIRKRDDTSTLGKPDWESARHPVRQGNGEGPWRQ
jgi:polysaccharide biosynthesis protein PslJ